MAEKKTEELMNILKSHEKEFRMAAPKYVNTERLMGLAIQAKMRNHLLAKCSPVSVVDFCMKMAETGTDKVGAGGMWAVPYWNNKNKGYDMTAIPDWRLIVEKAKQAKAIKHATAEVVYEKDKFDYERGLSPNLIHKPSKSQDRGKIVAAYCVYTLPDGTKDFEVMTREELDNIRSRSKTKSDTSPWNTDYKEMAKKTVIKRTLKVFEGASPELTKLIHTDNEVVGFPDITSQEEPISEPQAVKHEKVVDVEPEQEEEKPKTKKSEATEETNEEPEQEEGDVNGNSFVDTCEGCGTQISSKVADFSQKKYGKKLCIDCQKLQ